MCLPRRSARGRMISKHVSPLSPKNIIHTKPPSLRRERNCCAPPFLFLSVFFLRRTQTGSFRRAATSPSAERRRKPAPQNHEYHPGPQPSVTTAHNSRGGGEKLRHQPPLHSGRSEDRPCCLDAANSREISNSWRTMITELLEYCMGGACQ